MRFRFAAVVVAMLVLASCGSQPAKQTASSSAAYRWCIRTVEPHYAFVVVQHMSGARIETCVNFSSSFIDGVAALSRSGVEFRAPQIGAMTVACQIDLEPAGDADCGPQSGGRWVTFMGSTAVWHQVGTDLTKIRLYDHQAIGWRYVATGAAAAPPSHL